MIDKVVGVVSELRGHPALLAVVLLQIATLAMVYMISTANADRQHERDLALIQACEEK